MMWHIDFYDKFGLQVGWDDYRGDRVSVSRHAYLLWRRFYVKHGAVVYRLHRYSDSSPLARLDDTTSSIRSFS